MTIPALSKLTLRIRRYLRGHQGKIYAMAWAENGRLVSASQDGKLIIWDGLTQNKTHAIPLKCTWVMSCGFSQNGSLISSGTLDNACTVYNMRAQDIARSSHELLGHAGYVSCTRFLSDGKILTSSGDQTCALWDIESKKRVIEYIDHDGGVMSCALSPDKQTFVSAGCDATSKLWDLNSNKCIYTFRGHALDINSVQWFPSGTGYGSAGDDGTCKLFDIRACRELNSYEMGSILCGVTSISFSSSGRLLFAGYDDQNCLIWDTLRNEKIFSLNGHDKRVSCLSVSNDGKAVCTGSWDMNLKIWA